jgi:hypothetical protein
MIMKKAMTGEIDLFGPAKAVAKELMSIPSFDTPSTELFAEEKKVLKNLKKSILMVAGTAAQKLGDKLALEQEVMMNISDMIIEVYMLESALLKTEKLIAKNGREKHEEKVSMCINFLHHSVEEIRKNGKEALFAIAEGDEQKMLLMGLKRFTKVQPTNLKEHRRLIAKKLIEENKYCFD